MNNDDFMKMSEILEEACKRSTDHRFIVGLCVSQVLLIVAFLLHSVGGLF